LIIYTTFPVFVFHFNVSVTWLMARILFCFKLYFLVEYLPDTRRDTPFPPFSSFLSANFDPLFTKICAKTICTFSFPMTLTFHL